MDIKANIEIRSFICIDSFPSALLVFDDNVKLHFNKDSVTIYNSYKQNKKKTIKKMVEFIRFYAEDRGYSIGCSDAELYGEIRLHNFLYWLGYKREQTGTCDLDFNGDRRWYVVLLSKLIGWLNI